MASSSMQTSSLQRRPTLAMPPREQNDDKRLVAPRQVSPSLPELETEASSLSFSNDAFSPSLRENSDESTSTYSGSFSLSSPCSSQESVSSNDDEEDSCVLAHDDDKTTTTPRRLKHTSKWCFCVGTHADKRSHGHHSSNHGRRWSTQSFELLEVDFDQGAFGHVHMARDTNNNKIVVLKEIFKSTILKKGSIQSVRAEVEIQTSLNHEHILQSFGYFDGEKSISLVLEYAPHGNLYEYMKECCKDQKVPLSQAQVLIRQVASALSYLESRHVAHRDVKSENVLITQHKGHDMIVKLCDFGYSAQFTPDDDLRTTMCGTPEFVAPEIITNEDYCCRFVDPWALGIMTYELVLGRSPFYMDPRIKNRIAEERGYDESYYVITDEIRNFTVLERPRTCENDDFFNFVSCLVQLEPFERLSATQALGHSWLRCDAKELDERAMKRIKVEV